MRRVEGVSRRRLVRKNDLLNGRWGVGSLGSVIGRRVASRDEYMSEIKSTRRIKYTFVSIKI